MKSLVSSTLSLLQAWPGDVAAKINYHQSRLSALGNHAADLLEREQSLPPASLLRQAYGPEITGRAPAARLIAENYGTMSSYALSHRLGWALQDADAGLVKRLNPAFRRSLFVLCERFCAPAQSPDEAMMARIDRAYGLAQGYHRHTRPGELFHSSNQNLLMVIIGLRRIVKHAAFRDYALHGQLPPQRKALQDFLSCTGFVLATVIWPLYAGKKWSPSAALGACLCSLAAGGLVLRLLRIKAHPRSFPQLKSISLC